MMNGLEKSSIKTELGKVYRYTSMVFHHFYEGEQLLRNPACFPGQHSPSKRGSTLRGNNLLLEELFLSVRVYSPVGREANFTML